MFRFASQKKNRDQRTVESLNKKKKNISKNERIVQNFLRRIIGEKREKDWNDRKRRE